MYVRIIHWYYSSFHTGILISVCTISIWSH